MDNNFALHIPAHSLSFGQVSIAIARAMYKKGLQPSIFPIGQPDFSAQARDDDFLKWFQSGLSKATYAHQRKWPVFKLWHLAGSLESFSQKQALFSFYECSEPTREEINIVRNNSKVIFSSNYAVNCFKDAGCDNVTFVPLGFDDHNYKVSTRKYFQDGRIVFNLAGKFEPKRKAHAQIIKTWLSRYANNPKYHLQAAIYNPFLKRQLNGQIVDDNAAHINQLLEGKKYFNLSFLNFMESNAAYCDFLNSGNICIELGNEGWANPGFTSTCLGKYCIALGATAQKDWSDNNNAIIVPINGKTKCADSMFFYENQPYNQGSFYTFSDESFLEACETAIKRVETNPVNEEGLKLQTKFTYEKTADKILNILENL